MKSLVMIVLFVMSVFVLAACGGQTVGVNAPVVEAPEVAAPQVEAPQVDGPRAAAASEMIVDDQGAVSVAVTPLNAGQDGATLDFEVAMNTHSVDLSMNLAELATLVTDTGQEVTATAWSGEAGGHHVSGVLSFPTAGGGAALLEGATTITLSLENVDAPVRTFTWRLK
ncbi:MAG TPA: hypothetical protein VK879_02710 [Candidatus Sulfomarinibacteraceae bacterium]|nr:hypothetical protein [Candidatus Sulfomarinibacteraceae bacterium]